MGADGRPTASSLKERVGQIPPSCPRCSLTKHLKRGEGGSEGGSKEGRKEADKGEGDRENERRKTEDRRKGKEEGRKKGRERDRNSERAGNGNRGPYATMGV